MLTHVPCLYSDLYHDNMGEVRGTFLLSFKVSDWIIEMALV